MNSKIHIIIANELQLAGFTVGRLVSPGFIMNIIFLLFDVKDFKPS